MTRIVKKHAAVADLESAMVRVVCARGAISRTELARELKLVPSTAGIYADRLIQSGYLTESKAVTPSPGRPPVLIRLNPRGGRFIGVDFDARQIMTVAVDFAQRPLEQARRTIPARATTERVLGAIEESLREVVGERPEDVLGIGMGVPGPVDAHRGIALDYKFIRDWCNVEIKARIASTFNVPVFVENNVRSMVLGELWCGGGQGLRDLVCLGIRSGIGSGIVVGGKLLHGANNLAGEIGRWACPEEVLPGPGAPAAPESAAHPRTIEDVASVTALLAEAGERLAQGQQSALGKPGDLPTIVDLIDVADHGDALARSIVERAAWTHAWITHHLALLLDPERVIIVGPLVYCRVYLDALQQSLTRLAGPKLGSRVVPSTLGEYAGALGASALAFHHWRPRR